MEQWWQDKELIEMQKNCDDAYYSKDTKKLQQLSNECYKLGHKNQLGILIRASYLYCAATSLLDMVSLGENLEKGEEKLYEKCFYLMRTAIDLCDEEYRNFKKTDEETHQLYIPYFNGLYNQLSVNYANLLSQNGRLGNSIGVLRNVMFSGFPMAVGNLALKIVDYSYFDKSHQKILLYESYNLLKKVLDGKQDYPEKNEAVPIFSRYLSSIESSLGIDYLEKNYKLSDFLYPIENMSIEEEEYRKWCSYNHLSLNQLNDLFSETEVGYDPLHLPSLTTRVDSPIIPRYHGIFNQVKQEYASARYWVYEGLNDRKIHFSDKKVYLVDTLDYPVYGVGIEKMKAAYRSVYSIFDKIAYFLNLYLNLGIDSKRISFHTLWFKREKGKEIRREKLELAMENNYCIRGLWWLYKDIKNKTVYADKYIDPIMKKVSDVRNAMEHRYLKILDYYEEVISEQNPDRFDNFAYNVSFSDFEKMTISLFQHAREAIILLTMIVKVEEDRKESHKNPNELVGEMNVYSYDDDWKQIF